MSWNLASARLWTAHIYFPLNMDISSEMSATMCSMQHVASAATLAIRYPPSSQVLCFNSRFLVSCLDLAFAFAFPLDNGAATPRLAKSKHAGLWSHLTMDTFLALQIIMKLTLSVNLGKTHPFDFVLIVALQSGAILDTGCLGLRKGCVYLFHCGAACLPIANVGIIFLTKVLQSNSMKCCSNKMSTFAEAKLWRSVPFNMLNKENVIWKPMCICL